MGVTVRIPSPLQKLVGGKATVEASGGTVGDLIRNLDNVHPGVRDSLLDEAGLIRRFINVYVNEEDIRFLEGVATTLREGDTVAIVPAIAGGSGDCAAALTPWSGTAGLGSGGRARQGPGMFVTLWGRYGLAEVPAWMDG